MVAREAAAAPLGTRLVAVNSDLEDPEVMLNRLERLLAAGDFAAAAVARECASVLAERSGERARRFADLARSYDYPQALALLRELRGAAPEVAAVHD